MCAGQVRSFHGSRQDREQELLDFPLPGIPSLTSGDPGIDPGIGGFRGDYESMDFAGLGCLARAAPREPGLLSSVKHLRSLCTCVREPGLRGEHGVGAATTGIFPSLCPGAVANGELAFWGRGFIL